MRGRLHGWPVIAELDVSGCGYNCHGLFIAPRFGVAVGGCRFTVVDLVVRYRCCLASPRWLVLLIVLPATLLIRVTGYVALIGAVPG